MCFPQFSRSFSSLLFLLEIKHHEHPPPRLAFQFCRTEIVNNYLCNGLPFLSPIQSGNDNQRLRAYLLWWPLLDVSCRGQEVECESQHRGNHIAQSSTIRIPREYQECLWLLYFFLWSAVIRWVCARRSISVDFAPISRPKFLRKNKKQLLSRRGVEIEIAKDVCKISRLIRSDTMNPSCF